MKKSLWTALYVGIGILLFVIQGGFPTYTNAQTTPEEAALINTDDIGMKVTPEIPGAFQNVEIELESYLTNINRAFITWKKNGVVVIAKYGQRKFNFSTGDVGEVITIDIEMILTSGEFIKKKLIVNPSEINLVWEGVNVYTPPFYRGRALPTSEGFFRVFAIPQIKNIAQLTSVDNYVFTWKRNDKVLQNASGHNKNGLLLEQDYLNPVEKIEVVGQNNATGAVAHGNIDVTVFQPKILLYDRDPIYGIDWSHELGSSFNVSISDKTILAAPYFFSPKNPLSDLLKYTWSINDDTINTPVIKNMLTIKSGQNKGVANVKLKIEAPTKLFLDAQRNIIINLK